MSKIMSGTVRGKTIELDELPGLVDGQRVAVELKPNAVRSNWQDIVGRLEGSLAEGRAFAAASEQIQQDRKSATRPAVDL